MPPEPTPPSTGRQATHSQDFPAAAGRADRPSRTARAGRRAGDRPSRRGSSPSDSPGTSDSPSCRYPPGSCLPTSARATYAMPQHRRRRAPGRWSARCARRRLRSTAPSCPHTSSPSRRCAACQSSSPPVLTAAVRLSVGSCPMPIRCRRRSSSAADTGGQSGARRGRDACQTACSRSPVPTESSSWQSVARQTAVAAVLSCPCLSSPRRVPVPSSGSGSLRAVSTSRRPPSRPPPACRPPCGLSPVPAPPPASVRCRSAESCVRCRCGAVPTA